MAFDKDTNTITLDQSSDLIVDYGVLVVHMLRKTALSGDAPIGMLEDWKVIEKWLGCKGGNITSIDDEKINKAWKAYLANGVAPSFKLQKTFDFYKKHYGDEGHIYTDDKPPTEVMDVFDRLLATDRDISAKKNHDDWAEKKKKWEGVANEAPKKNLTVKQRTSSLSKNSRIFIAGSITWSVWVFFRTSDDWEILGVNLDSWDEDMFFANVALPIVVGWLAFKTYKWVASASK